MARQSLLKLLFNGTQPPAVTTAATEAPYDHSGAMWFVVTVVSVYAMAILFMIVSHINRRSNKRELDRNVNAFLRSAPAVRIEEERQRRRNLKRAMQPFINLALNRRTVGVQVRVSADSGELATLPSMEALQGIPGLPLRSSVERLSVGHRVVSSRRSSRTRRQSAFQLLLPPQDSSRRSSAAAAVAAAAAEYLANDSGWRSEGSSSEQLEAPSSTGDFNDKAIQCALNPQETLETRCRLLRPVLSASDLGSSASSLRFLSATGLPPQQLVESPTDAAESLGHSLSRSHWQALMGLERYQNSQNPATEASASRTHVPRFLAF